MNNLTTIAVIVTFNRLQLLQRCVQHVLNQSTPVAKIIIVDNNSTDGTIDWINELSATSNNIQSIRLPINIGGAGGFSAGMKRAVEINADFIWVMDDDAFPEKHCLQELLLCKDRHPDAWAICPMIVGTLGETQVYHHKIIKKNLVEKSADITDLSKRDFIIDANAFVGPLILSTAIHKIGYPNEDFFIWYDDTEYTLRLSRTHKIYLCRNAVIWHETPSPGNATFGWKHLYLVRNRYWTAIHMFGIATYIYNTAWVIYKLLSLLAKPDKTEFSRTQLASNFITIITEAHKKRMNKDMFLKT